MTSSDGGVTAVTVSDFDSTLHSIRGYRYKFIDIWRAFGKLLRATGRAPLTPGRTDTQAAARSEADGNADEETKR